MTLIKNHDYVMVTHWVCPHCKYRYEESTYIGGRFYPSKLFCNKSCGLYFSPALVQDISYQESEK